MQRTRRSIDAADRRVVHGLAISRLAVMIATMPAGGVPPIATCAAIDASDGGLQARPKPRATDLRRYTGYPRVCCGACEWTPVISRMGSTFISYGRSVVRLRSEQHGCPSTQPIWQ